MFTLTINTGNAAFEGDPTAEVARILRKVAYRIEGGDTSFRPRDSNGNAVGQAELTPDV